MVKSLMYIDQRREGNKLSPEVENQSNPSSSSNNTNLSVLPDLIGPILKDVYGDAVSPGAKKVGTALETVLDFGYTYLLMPLQHASDKKKLNFQKNLEVYKKKLESIEEEDIVEVSPELGIPILQRLNYIQNDDIVNLFTSLLASASSIRTCSLAHPGFIKIIENLSVDEAKILNHFANNDINDIPFIMFKLRSEEGTCTASSCLTGIDKMTELELLFPENDHFYIDNLLGLGLLEKSEEYLMDDKIYSELEDTYQDFKRELVESLKSNPSDLGPDAKIFIKKGMYKKTYYAESFFQACIKPVRR